MSSAARLHLGDEPLPARGEGIALMKLVFVVKSLSIPGGGAERVLAEVTGGLVERGHDVTVVSFDQPASKDFYTFHEKVKRVRLDIDPAGRSGMRQTFLRMLALRKCVRAMSPDAAVGFMHSAYIPLGLALVATGIPAIASEHIVYGHYEPRVIERTLIQLVAPLFYAFTAISDEMRRGFPDGVRGRMAVVPNPVSAAPERCADPMGPAIKVILTIGRMEAQKDHKTLLRAFASIAERFPQWRLRVVGDGSLRSDLEQLIRNLGVGSQVTLVGTTRDVSSEYLAAQLFVIPSSYESFGLVTAEALAHGLPVVGFADCPGTNTLIVDGENGLLVSGDDRASALATGLARLMEAPAERVRMGLAAPAHVAAFAPDRIVERWAAITSAAVAKVPHAG